MLDACISQRVRLGLLSSKGDLCVAVCPVVGGLSQTLGAFFRDLMLPLALLRRCDRLASDGFSGP